MNEAFNQLAGVHDEDLVLYIGAREIQRAARRAGVGGGLTSLRCVVAPFAERLPEIATQFHTVLLSGVPYASQHISLARRFTTVVDRCAV